MVEILKEDKKKFFILVNFIVLLVYFKSLFRPWLPFDERLFYNEEFLPIPQSLNEIFEIINSFVKNCHIVSMNTFFSDHATLRYDPINWALLVFILYLFKKSAFLYHLFQLSIHLLNTSLVWCIFCKIHGYLKEGQAQGLPLQSAIVISLFTLLWALHPVNIEAVLLTTNWNTILMSTFCFGFILYELSLFKKQQFQMSYFRFTLITVLFFMAMYLSEYGYTLPFIMFFLLLSLNFFLSRSIKSAFVIAVKKSLPYFLGLSLFALVTFIKADSPLVNFSDASSQLYSFTERNLWLTPQIFIHLLKLLFFPKELSTYQSNLVHLSDTLFSPYSIFCLVAYLLLLLLPLVLFILFKKHSHSYLFLLSYSFYFSLVPFLHIVLPTYCLSAERYCYFPLAMLVLLFVAIGQAQGLPLQGKKFIIVLSIILLLFTTRTLIRIQEWENPLSFYKSALKVDTNPLFKAHKYLVFANFLRGGGDYKQVEKSLTESMRLLDIALKLFQDSSNKYLTQPITLELYGLSQKALLLKTAYTIATIRSDHYHENPKSILSFYEPFIKNKLNIAGINQIALYASLLANNNQEDEAKKVIELGLKKYPYSPELLMSLVNFYLYKKNLKMAWNILERSYKLFPNDMEVLQKMFFYHNLQNDMYNMARFAYLLGLRSHSQEWYKTAYNFYMALGQTNQAKKVLNKLHALKYTLNGQSN